MIADVALSMVVVAMFSVVFVMLYWCVRNYNRF